MQLSRGIYQILGAAGMLLGRPGENFRCTSARQGALEHLLSQGDSGWTLS